VLRYAWAVAKLVLVIGVILVGALVLGPGTDAMRHGDGGAEGRLIAGAGYDVIALTVATGLSVFKPGRRRTRETS
jgi:ABC-type Mn2+/Zn2+ transport system permease subunit